MNYAALEALENQAELVRVYGEFWEGKKNSIVPQFPKEVAGMIAAVCEKASTCYLAPQIQEMLIQAMPTLPDTIPLREDDIPFANGFMKLAREIKLQPRIDTMPNSWDVYTSFAWIRSPDAVHIFWFGYSIRDGESNKLLQYHTAVTWRYGKPLDDPELLEEFFKSYGKEDLSVRTTYGNGKELITTETIEKVATGTYLVQLALLSWAYSIWHFMAQKVAARERVRPDRAMRRRMGPEKEDSFVDVITLRATERRKEQEFEEAAKHHVSVRFWVRAHWRKQWYPSEQVNKPIWISSHVKGPDGAKFVGPTKLFAITR